MFVREIFSDIQDVNVVSDGYLSNIEEFFLLRECKHFIIPTTTYSWWPAYLGSYLDKIIISAEPQWPSLFNFDTLQKQRASINQWNLSKFKGWIDVNPFTQDSDYVIRLQDTNK
ncbi:glycosyltransferase family 11 [Stylonychia lemnae]|uniref:Glycosyltransferase family 11 n=1 Tax=Stylonychia lemnae TaxID=5949 RepID=A0A078AWS1_STYLE|nr:glycosyltransferase family 11 [Stylonychia lemnae]|eukprot:CDW86875.1 glycosyltransferase family 11 [Stylonychia lemnae]